MEVIHLSQVDQAASLARTQPAGSSSLEIRVHASTTPAT